MQTHLFTSKENPKVGDTVTSQNGMKILIQKIIPPLYAGIEVGYISKGLPDTNYKIGLLENIQNNSIDY